MEIIPENSETDFGMTDLQQQKQPDDKGLQAQDSFDGLERIVSNELTRLSSEQKKIIKETMEILQKDQLANGVTILIKFISEYPEVKRAWPQFRPIPDSAIISSDVIKNFALVYMQGLGRIADCMDDQVALSTALRRIAKSHVKWQISKQHILDMLSEFLSVLRSKIGRDQVIENTWCTFFSIIGNLVEHYKNVSK